MPFVLNLPLVSVNVEPTDKSVSNLAPLLLFSVTLQLLVIPIVEMSWLEVPVNAIVPVGVAVVLLPKTPPV